MTRSAVRDGLFEYQGLPQNPSGYISVRPCSHNAVLACPLCDLKPHPERCRAFSPPDKLSPFDTNEQWLYTRPPQSSLLSLRLRMLIWSTCIHDLILSVTKSRRSGTMSTVLQMLHQTVSPSHAPFSYTSEQDPDVLKLGAATRSWWKDSTVFRQRTIA